jgi:hypothetical protein
MLLFIKKSKNFKVVVIPQVSVSAKIIDSNDRLQEVLKLGYICSDKQSLTSSCFTGNWELIEAQAEAQSLAVKAFNIAHENSFCKESLAKALKEIGFSESTNYQDSL